jgi:chromosome partitioning protein
MADQPFKARIITTFNEKGGAGKTTLSCNLAHTLARRGFDVQLLDLDGQRAATQWAGAHRKDGAEGFGASVWSGDLSAPEVIAEETEKFARKYDVIIADCAPSVAIESTWAMLLMSDLALIPTKLSKIDLDALRQAKMLAKRAQEEAQAPYPVRVVATGVRMHMNDDKFFVEQLHKDKNFPLLDEMLGFRQAYPRSRLVGSSVHGVAGADDAIREIEALADRVLKIVGLPNTKKGGTR